MPDTPISQRMIAYDNFADAFDDGFDYYPDKGAVSAYVEATKTYLPLTGIVREAFRNTNAFRKEHPGMNQRDRCSAILAEWNREHPDQLIADPFR